MCEPSHSIVQVTLNSHQHRMLNLGKTPIDCSSLFPKEIGNYAHYSALGNGHSETASLIGLRGQDSDRLILYEAQWWDRKFALDGYGEVEQDAFDSAKRYAEKVSIGSLHALRSFLEKTLQKTNRIHMYHMYFRSILNVDGRREFDAKIKKAYPRPGRFNFSGDDMDTNRVPFTKICLGLTRKRKLLVPEWADDNPLWSAV